MTIDVLRPGALTTVQDLGRHGWQRDGVPVSGAMDTVALRMANWLAGNDSGAAALEATLVGPELRFDADAVIAVAGADMDARVGERRISPWHAVRVRAGETLTLDAARVGCRAYVAVRGGIDVPPVLGSRSTYVRAGLGGLAGRALQKGDVLMAGASGSPTHHAQRGIDLRDLALQRTEVRYVAGPYSARLDAASQQALARDAFTVGRDSDRMGIRLQGPALALESRVEPLSAGVAFGTMQLPPNGAPIVLMADRQTTGGYPRIGEVASVDLPVLAQARPGDALRFRQITHDEAERLYLARERELDRFRRFLTMPS